MEIADDINKEITTSYTKMLKCKNATIYVLFTYTQIHVFSVTAMQTHSQVNLNVVSFWIATTKLSQKFYKCVSFGKI